MSVAQALVKSSTSEVAVGGVQFRVRRLVSADLLKHGGIFLLAAAKAPPAKREAAILAALKAPGAEQQAELMLPAVLAAGVVAASADEGKTWEPLTVVTDLREENAAVGKVHITALPPSADQVLFKAIMRLSNGGVSAKCLATFLESNAASSRPARKPVRD